MTAEEITQPESEADDAHVSDSLTFRDLVFSDLKHYHLKKPSWTAVFVRSIVNPGLAATVVLRAQQRLFHRGHPRIAFLLRNVGVWFWSADLVPGMKIGPGLYMPHPMGITIGGGLRIGSNVTILQGVTAGTRDPAGVLEHEYATVGDGVILSTHAVLLGGVSIGDHAHVGANTVVLSDVPEGAVMFGVPARRVGTREPGGGTTPD